MLPNDIINIIMLYMDYKSICDLDLDDYFWKQKFKYDYVSFIEIERDWKELYYKFYIEKYKFLDVSIDCKYYSKIMCIDEDNLFGSLYDDCNDIHNSYIPLWFAIETKTNDVGIIGLFYQKELLLIQDTIIGFKDYSCYTSLVAEGYSQLNLYRNNNQFYKKEYAREIGQYRMIIVNENRKENSFLFETISDNPILNFRKKLTTSHKSHE